MSLFSSFNVKIQNFHIENIYFFIYIYILIWGFWTLLSNSLFESVQAIHFLLHVELNKFIKQIQFKHNMVN